MCMQEPMSKIKFTLTILGFVTKFLSTLLCNLLIFGFGIFIGMGFIAVQVKDKIKEVSTSTQSVERLEKATAEFEQLKEQIELKLIGEQTISTNKVSSK